MADIQEKLNQVEAEKRGTPEEFMGRKYLKSSEVKTAFVCDANPIIINKPKFSKKKEDDKDGERVRATNRFGEPLFEDVVWLPIELNGTQCVVCTIQPDVAKLVRTLEAEEPVVTNDKEFGDADRIVKIQFKDKFDGDLMFKAVRVKYGNGKEYDNYLLAKAE